MIRIDREISKELDLIYKQTVEAYSKEAKCHAFHAMHRARVNSQGYLHILRADLLRSAEMMKADYVFFATEKANTEAAGLVEELVLYIDMNYGLGNF